ncbi:MAG: DNA polymerase III subunit alpha [Ignavibacteria bacterium RBG_13_36_8]|nr:MAG: DNA polymerase III subunit alpha [Ignavibacteria bacterium RBG_13_36_8]
MGDFVHLHNHSHYSLQDAACTIDKLVETTVEMGMHSIALTDHGVMYGATEFYKKAVKAGIKPIIGMEAYIVMDGTRFDRGTENVSNGRQRSKHYNHLILLAKNETGYRNLIKLSSIGFTEGFYYKPRIDLDVLKQKCEGLICTSACPAGVVSTHLVNGDYEKAKQTALLFKEIFGNDFYLEIQDHGMDIEKPILTGMPKLSKELGIKLVATNDIHYIEQEHSIPHNVLLLLSDKTGNSDYRSLRYNTDQVYFKSAEEMKKIFKNFPGAIENTLEIEEKVNFEMDFDTHHYPNFPIPPDARAQNLNEYLDILAHEGLNKKFKKVTPEILDRFNYELEVIKGIGYAGYFLIVQDFINSAKQRGTSVGPGRGSVAGSLVAYVLGITNVNPLDYDLLFERFLNPERRSMPDIDVDFADDKRGEVIDYVKGKYGENSVCQIITFNRLSSKAVIRDVARVLKIPIPTVNNITKWIPSKFGRVYTIDMALNEVPELKWVRDSDDPTLQELIKYSRVLEGMNRNASKHAAGVVITEGNVSDYVPLAIAGTDNDLVTQYNMKELESVGLLKMDFLGLRTLTIIRDTIELVKKTRGNEIDIDNIPLDDKKTYELFSKGQTTGIFQFESPPMREYLKKLKPSSIKDLAAMNALYRPGPMQFIDDFIACKHGRKSIKYQHPILEPILRETYGIIVYQEQVIQIANKVAGMSLAEADSLRRAMGKKDKVAMDRERKKFIEGAIKNNLTKKIAEDIYDAILKFADYGFNKSHAVAYSIVAYQTAYLKSHYLEEFLAANLTNEFGDIEKVTKLLEDCRKLKVIVLPPSVNKPTVSFIVENREIVFGMSAIKNVGVGAVQEIARSHNKIGRNFNSIYDFCSYVDTRIVNKRALEGLVLAGAFDSTEGSRAQNFYAITGALNFGSKVNSAKLSQKGSLFGSEDDTLKIEEPPLPNIPSWDSKTRLAKEREVLGFYLSDHPLSKFKIESDSFANFHLGDASTYENMDVVRVCGVITELRTRMDKSGNNMAFFKLDDQTGSCECIMFSKTYSEYQKYISEEATILVKGKLESSGDAIKLHAEEVIPLNEAKYKLTKKLALYIDEQLHGEKVIENLKMLFENYEGNTPVFLRVKQNGPFRDFYLRYKVKLSDELINRILELLGDDSIHFVVN